MKKFVPSKGNLISMKQYTKISYLLKAVFCLSYLLIFSFANAQDNPKRLSGSIQLGVPVTFFSVKSNPTGIYTAAIRYSFSRKFSMEVQGTSNSFYNSGTGNPSKTTLNKTLSDVSSYKTPVYGVHLIGYYNLHNVFNLNTKPDNRFLPYVSLGLGLNIYKPEVTYTNGTSTQDAKFGLPYRAYELGLGTRYFINNNLDFYGGAAFHYNESYYIDGFKETSNPKLDNYLNLYAGVSVKLAAKPWNNLIDWNYKNIENTNEEVKSYSKFALDATLGLPYLFTSVGHKVTGMYNLGLRYSFNRAIGLQVNFAQGKVAGEQIGSSTAADNTPESVNSFTTSLDQVTLRAYFNVFNLLEEKISRAQWNHYLILGGGYLKATGDATLANGKNYTGRLLYKEPGIQNIVLGYEARKYMNSYFDLIGGVDFSYNQSKYLDQAGSKPHLNNHLYVHTGITYKIGATKDKEHIDWSYSNYSNYKNKKAVIEQELVIARPPVAPKVDTSRMVVIPMPVDTAKDAIAVVPSTKENVIEPIVENPVVVAPKVEVPVTPTPKVEVPVVVTPTPKVETPKASTPKVTVPATPKPNVVAPKTITPAENNQVNPETTPVTVIPNGVVTVPTGRYSVVVACYSINRMDVALAYQAVLISKGYLPTISKSKEDAKIVRLVILSTDKKLEALIAVRKARRNVEPGAWLYLYNKQ